VNYRSVLQNNTQNKRPESYLRWTTMHGNTTTAGDCWRVESGRLSNSIGSLGVVVTLIPSPAVDGSTLCHREDVRRTDRHIDDVFTM